MFEPICIELAPSAPNTQATANWACNRIWIYFFSCLISHQGKWKFFVTYGEILPSQWGNIPTAGFPHLQTLLLGQHPHLCFWNVYLLPGYYKEAEGSSKGSEQPLVGSRTLDFLPLYTQQLGLYFWSIEIHGIHSDGQMVQVSLNQGVWL